MVTTIAHLSDLRFGAMAPAMAAAVLADIEDLAPDLVVVSGNLTRRATKDQFAQARRFLESVTAPQVVVPGPRDIERLNLISRFFRPLHAYRSGITADLAPEFSNADVAVLGIDTSRSGIGKKISVAQAGLIRSKLGSCHQVAVLATHHPLVIRPASGTTTISARPGTRDVHVVGKCVDVVLAGHQAVGGPQDSRVAYRVLEKQTIVAQAVISPSSSGLRDSTPYYNAVRIDVDRVSIAVRLWRGSAFEEQGAKSYRFGDGRWEKVVDVPSDFQWNDAGT